MLFKLTKNERIAINDNICDKLGKVMKIFLIEDRGWLNYTRFTGEATSYSYVLLCFYLALLAFIASYAGDGLKWNLYLTWTRQIMCITLGIFLGIRMIIRDFVRFYSFFRMVLVQGIWGLFNFFTFIFGVKLFCGLYAAFSTLIICLNTPILDQLYMQTIPHAYFVLLACIESFDFYRYLLMILPAKASAFIKKKQKEAKRKRGFR